MKISSAKCVRNLVCYILVSRHQLDASLLPQENGVMKERSGMRSNLLRQVPQKSFLANDWRALYSFPIQNPATG